MNENMNEKKNRRDFLKKTATFVGGLVVATPLLSAVCSRAQAQTYYGPGYYGSNYYGYGYFGPAYNNNVIINNNYYGPGTYFQGVYY